MLSVVFALSQAAPLAYADALRAASVAGDPRRSSRALALELLGSNPELQERLAQRMVEASQDPALRIHSVPLQFKLPSFLGGYVPVEAVHAALQEQGLSATVKPAGRELAVTVQARGWSAPAVVQQVKTVVANTMVALASGPVKILEREVTLPPVRDISEFTPAHTLAIVTAVVERTAKQFQDYPEPIKVDRQVTDSSARIVVKHPRLQWERQVWVSLADPKIRIRAQVPPWQPEAFLEGHLGAMDYELKIAAEQVPPPPTPKPAPAAPSPAARPVENAPAPVLGAQPPTPGAGGVAHMTFGGDHVDMGPEDPTGLPALDRARANRDAAWRMGATGAGPVAFVGGLPAAVVAEEIATGFADLFGTKTVNGRQLSVEETIGALTVELEPAIQATLSARRQRLESPAPVMQKYAWPAWNEQFTDATGKTLTFREIVQGMIDNFLGRDTELRWRLNDEVPIPEDANPLTNAGLELTGPWHPLDMAMNQLNAGVAAIMPDDEDASPAHFRPYGAPSELPIGVYLGRRNMRQIMAGEWGDGHEPREYRVVKKGAERVYTIQQDRTEWPTVFQRVPGIHLRDHYITVNGKPVPSIVVSYVLHTLNNYGSLQKAGTGQYHYQPKILTPQEALVVEQLLGRLEGLIGVPVGSIKIKALYEEGVAGLHLPAIAWVLRRRLIGTNVGRWDYLGSLIEMWKDEAVFPDPQSIGMAAPNMVAYQRYNALMMLMAGMKDGQLTNGAPIGGMAAVMIYPPSDPYGRAKYNPIALRSMKIDKLRERLLGLIFVPEEPLADGRQPTLQEILSGQVKGKLYDTYRQSWVASPEAAYVAAGTAPLRVSLEELQAMIDAVTETQLIAGKPVPTAASGLIAGEREVLQRLSLLSQDGRITPWVVSRDIFDAPEKLFTQDLWDSIYGVPQGDITVERIQHALYMAANYGFQILNGNYAAAIDDYELHLRFMNDLATYRIDVNWLWSVLHHQAAVTRDGYLKAPELTGDGVVPASNAVDVAAGTPVTPELFQQLWELHHDWTEAFFAEQDRRGDPSRFNRSKAPIIMEILKRQLLSPRYIQHSARVLFAVAEADDALRAQILDAIFSPSRAAVVEKVRRGEWGQAILDAHDYVYDIVPEAPAPRVTVSAGRIAVQATAPGTVRQTLFRANLSGELLDRIARGDVLLAAGVPQIPEGGLLPVGEVDFDFGLAAGSVVTLTAIPEVIFGRGFGYDIRGQASDAPELGERNQVTLTPAVTELIGKALGSRHPVGARALVTGDHRETTPALRDALIAGLRSVGINLDVTEEFVPTGAASRKALAEGYDLTVQFSGSHNPWYANGLKITEKQDAQGRPDPQGIPSALFGPGLVEVRDVVRARAWRQDAPQGTLTPIGGVVDDYINALDALLPPLAARRVVVDSGNGVGGRAMAELLRRRGVEVVELFSDPHPRFPNHPADPSKDDTQAPYAQSGVRHASEKVRELNAARQPGELPYVAILLDGDGDRSAFLDEAGQPIAPERVLVALYHRFILENQQAIAKLNAIGHTVQLALDVRASGVVKDLLGQYDGVEGVFIPAGYPSHRKFVRQQIAEVQRAAWVAGLQADPDIQRLVQTYTSAEASGHYFYATDASHADIKIDDGIYAAVLGLHLLDTAQEYEARSRGVSLPAQARYTLEEFFRVIPRLPVTTDIRDPVDEQAKFDIVRDAKAAALARYGNQLQATEGVSEVDGLKTQQAEVLQILEPFEARGLSTIGFRTELDRQRRQLESAAATVQPAPQFIDNPGYAPGAILTIMKTLEPNQSLFFTEAVVEAKGREALGAAGARADASDAIVKGIGVIAGLAGQAGVLLIDATPEQQARGYLFGYQRHEGPGATEARQEAEQVTPRPLPIKVFAQNVWALKEERDGRGPGSPLVGAYTGQDSYFEIFRAGATGSILTHSEIRATLGETDKDAREKFLGMRMAGLEPIVAIGEEKKDRYDDPEGKIENRPRAVAFVTTQIRNIFAGLDPDAVRGAVIAYEPRWAIGTSISAAADQVAEVHDAIRATLIELFGPEVAGSIRLLYGGRASPKNADKLFRLMNVDGFLVGTSSANPAEFAQMGRIMVEAWQDEAVRSAKQGRLPILAGNLKDLQRDLDADVAGTYQTAFASVDRTNLQVILAPPAARIREFAETITPGLVPAVSAPEITVAAGSDLTPDELARQAAALEARWKDEEARYGIRRDYSWQDYGHFFKNLPPDQQPKSAAEAVVRLRGALDLDTYNTTRANAAHFRELLRRKDDSLVLGLGSYTGKQAEMAIRAGQSLKAQGFNRVRTAAYLGGWNLAGDQNVDGLSLTDQSLFSSPASQIVVARTISNHLTLAARQAHLEGKPGTKEDWMPLTVIDLEAPPSPLHAFYYTLEAIKAGNVAGVHAERQAPGYKVCGHGGGACSRPTSEHNAVLRGIRLASDVADVPLVVIGRTDGTHEKFIVRDEPADRPFILGYADTADGQRVEELTYQEAVDRGFAGEWTDREIKPGPNGTWTPSRNADRLFRVRAGVERAIHDAVEMAPYVDMIWSDTHSIDPDERRVFAAGVHAKFPTMPLADNLSPNLQWEKVDDAALAKFWADLPTLGYKYVFMTLFGFINTTRHAFEFGRQVAQGGHVALAEFHRDEMKLADSFGYVGKGRQRIVGGVLNDAVAIMAGGDPGMAFLGGSTEETGGRGPGAQVAHMTFSADHLDMGPEDPTGLPALDRARANRDAAWRMGATGAGPVAFMAQGSSAEVLRELLRNLEATNTRLRMWPPLQGPVQLTFTITTITPGTWSPAEQLLNQLSNQFDEPFEKFRLPLVVLGDHGMEWGGRRRLGLIEGSRDHYSLLVAADGTLMMVYDQRRPSVRNAQRVNELVEVALAEFAPETLPAKAAELALQERRQALERIFTDERADRVRVRHKLMQLGLKPIPAVEALIERALAKEGPSGLPDVPFVDADDVMIPGKVLVAPLGALGAYEKLDPHSQRAIDSIAEDALREFEPETAPLSLAEARRAARFARLQEIFAEGMTRPTPQIIEALRVLVGLKPTSAVYALIRRAQAVRDAEWSAFPGRDGADGLGDPDAAAPGRDPFEAAPEDRAVAGVDVGNPAKQLREQISAALQEFHQLVPKPSKLSEETRTWLDSGRVAPEAINLSERWQALNTEFITRQGTRNRWTNDLANAVKAVAETLTALIKVEQPAAQILPGAEEFPTIRKALTGLVVQGAPLRASVIRDAAQPGTGVRAVYEPALDGSPSVTVTVEADAPAEESLIAQAIVMETFVEIPEEAEAVTSAILEALNPLLPSLPASGRAGGDAPEIAHMTFGGDSINMGPADPTDSPLLNRLRANKDAAFDMGATGAGPVAFIESAYPRQFRAMTSGTVWTMLEQAGATGEELDRIARGELVMDVQVPGMTESEMIPVPADLVSLQLGVTPGSVVTLTPAPINEIVDIVFEQLSEEERRLVTAQAIAWRTEPFILWQFDVQLGRAAQPDDETWNVVKRRALKATAERGSQDPEVKRALDALDERLLASLMSRGLTGRHPDGPSFRALVIDALEQRLLEQTDADTRRAIADARAARGPEGALRLIARTVQQPMTAGDLLGELLPIAPALLEERAGFVAPKDGGAVIIERAPTGQASGLTVTYEMRTSEDDPAIRVDLLDRVARVLAGVELRPGDEVTVKAMLPDDRGPAPASGPSVAHMSFVGDRVDMGPADPTGSPLLNRLRANKDAAFDMGATGAGPVAFIAGGGTGIPASGEPLELNVPVERITKVGDVLATLLPSGWVEVRGDVVAPRAGVHVQIKRADPDRYPEMYFEPNPTTGVIPEDVARMLAGVEVQPGDVVRLLRRGGSGGAGSSAASAGAGVGVGAMPIGPGLAGPAIVPEFAEKLDELIRTAERGHLARSKFNNPPDEWLVDRLRILQNLPPEERERIVAEWRQIEEDAQAANTQGRAAYRAGPEVAVRLENGGLAFFSQRGVVRRPDLTYYLIDGVPRNRDANAFSESRQALFAKVLPYIIAYLNEKFANGTTVVQTDRQIGDAEGRSFHARQLLVGTRYLQPALMWRELTFDLPEDQRQKAPDILEVSFPNWIDDITRWIQESTTASGMVGEVFRDHYKPEWAALVSQIKAAKLEQMVFKAPTRGGLSLHLGFDYMGEHKMGPLSIVMDKVKRAGGLAVQAALSVARVKRLDGAYENVATATTGPSLHGKSTITINLEFAGSDLASLLGLERDPQEGVYGMNDDIILLQRLREPLEVARGDRTVRIPFTVDGTESNFYSVPGPDEDLAPLRSIENVPIDSESGRPDFTRNPTRNMRIITPRQPMIERKGVRHVIETMTQGRLSDAVHVPMEAIDRIFWQGVMRQNTVVPPLIRLNPQRYVRQNMFGEAVQMGAAIGAIGKPYVEYMSDPFIIGLEDENATRFLELLRDMEQGGMPQEFYMFNTGGLGADTNDQASGEKYRKVPRELTLLLQEAVLRGAVKFENDPLLGVDVAVAIVNAQGDEVMDLRGWLPRNIYGEEDYARRIAELKQRRYYGKDSQDKAGILRYTKAADDLIEWSDVPAPRNERELAWALSFVWHLDRAYDTIQDIVNHRGEGRDPSVATLQAIRGLYETGIAQGLSLSYDDILRLQELKVLPALPAGASDALRILVVGMDIRPLLPQDPARPLAATFAEDVQEAVRVIGAQGFDAVLYTNPVEPPPTPQDVKSYLDRFEPVASGQAPHFASLNTAPGEDIVRLTAAAGLIRLPPSPTEDHGLLDRSGDQAGADFGLQPRNPTAETVDQAQSIMAVMVGEARDEVPPQMGALFFDGQSNRLGWFTQPDWLEVQDYLDAFSALPVMQGKRRLVFIGMGGSINTVKALIELQDDPADRAVYAFDSLDPAAAEFVAALGDDALVVMASKSATTDEVIALGDVLRARYSDRWQEHFLLLTDPGNEAKLVAKAPAYAGITSFPIQVDRQNDIGGRFTSPHTGIFFLPLLMLASRESIHTFYETYRAQVDQLLPAVLGQAEASAQAGDQRFAVVLPPELASVMRTWTLQLFHESLGNKKPGYNPAAIVVSSRDEVPANLGFRPVELNLPDGEPVVRMMVMSYLLQRFIAHLAYRQQLNAYDQPKVNLYKDAATALKGTTLTLPPVKSPAQVAEAIVQGIGERPIVHVVHYGQLSEERRLALQDQLRAAARAAGKNAWVEVFVGSDWNHHSYQAADGHPDILTVILTPQSYSVPAALDSQRAVLERNAETLRQFAQGTFNSLQASGSAALYFSLGAATSTTTPTQTAELQVQGDAKLLAEADLAGEPTLEGLFTPDSRVTPELARAMVNANDPRVVLIHEEALKGRGVPAAMALQQLESDLQEALREALQQEGLKALEGWQGALRFIVVSEAASAQLLGNLPARLAEADIAANARVASVIGPAEWAQQVKSAVELGSAGQVAAFALRPGAVGGGSVVDWKVILASAEAAAGSDQFTQRVLTRLDLALQQDAAGLFVIPEAAVSEHTEQALRDYELRLRQA